MVVLMVGCQNTQSKLPKVLTMGMKASKLDCGAMEEGGLV